MKDIFIFATLQKIITNSSFSRSVSQLLACFGLMPALLHSTAHSATGLILALSGLTPKQC